MLGINGRLGGRSRHEVVVVDAPQRQGQRASAARHHQDVDFRRLQGQGHRTRLNRPFLGSREQLAGREYQHVLQDGLGSRLVPFVGVVPDDVNMMTRQNESRDARLFRDVDGEGRIPLGILATSPGGVPLGPSFFSTRTSPSSMAVLTQRSSRSLNVVNALAGTADRAIRDRP